MMPSRGLHAFKGIAPRVYQQQCRNLSSRSRPASNVNISTKTRSPFASHARPAIASTITSAAFVRYASSTPVTSASSTSSAATTSIKEASTTSSVVPNIDTISLDDLSISVDAAAVPERIGYLKEIGIDFGIGPTSAIQWVLESFHVGAGLPWWGSIAATAVVLRLALFPLFLKSADTTARSMALTSITKPAMERMKEMQKAGDQAGAQAAMQEYFQIRSRAGISMTSQLMPVAFQAVLGYCGFKLMRAMASLPVPGLKDGGLWWLTDLTVPDGYLILPGLMAISIHMLGRLGGESGSTELTSPVMKAFMLYAMPGLILLITGWQPGALCVWFATTGMMGIGQALLLQRPGVRKFLRIAPLYKPSKTEGRDEGIYGIAMNSLRGSTPETTSTASTPAGKSSAYMRPTYQAPNLKRAHARSRSGTSTTSQHPEVAHTQEQASTQENSGVLQAAWKSMKEQQGSWLETRREKVKKRQREKALRDAYERRRRE